MATQNVVSAKITNEVKTEIKSHIDSIFKLLPFLIALTNEERQAGLKLGDKSVAFVDKAIDYANSNPALVPPYVDLAEIQKDYELQKDLVDILQWIKSLVQEMEDTQQEAGSEAYNSILGFYQAVKVASEKNVPGAKAIYEDLSKRYPGRKKSETPDLHVSKN